MRLVLQRVTQASVTVDGVVVGQIGRGLLALVGITEGDDDAAADWCCRRLLGTRMWEDDAGKAWARSVQSGGLELLLVSQFTLYGILKVTAKIRRHALLPPQNVSSAYIAHPRLQGNKPDFHYAMPPAKAKVFWEAFVARVEKAHPGKMQQGRFGAKMAVDLVNDGPVTLTLDSPVAAPPTLPPAAPATPAAPTAVTPAFTSAPAAADGARCLVMAPLATAVPSFARLEHLGLRPAGLKMTDFGGVRCLAALLTPALAASSPTCATPLELTQLEVVVRRHCRDALTVVASAAGTPSEGVLPNGEPIFQPSELF